jgi:DNA processing protein
VNIYWIWLSTLKHIGPVTQKNLLHYFHSPQKVFDATAEELSLVPNLSKKALDSILHTRNLKRAEEIENSIRKEKLSILTFNDKLYPSHAKQCKESPIVLYYKGNLQFINQAVGVVGARRCSNYAKKVAQELGTQLANLGVPVISGFAKGIDSYAQESCTRNGGYSIGFLAGGVDICYPREQLPLYHQILDSGGLFLSQHPPGTAPIPQHFIQRNALISAWSSSIVVVEASSNSGSLWTVDYARKQGKKVFAVPNRIDVPEAIGSNRLLAGGTKVYLGIDSLQLNPTETGRDTPTFKSIEISTETNNILNCLSTSSCSIPYLAHKLKMNEARLMEKLFSLELDGKLSIRGNMVYYV